MATRKDEGIFDAGLVDHPKVIALSRKLGIDRFSAIGCLVFFWAQVVKRYPFGNLGFLDLSLLDPPEGWPGVPGTFWSALFEVGLLDRNDQGAVSVHDWSTYSGKIARNRERIRIAVGLSRQMRQEAVPYATPQPPTARGRLSLLPTTPVVTSASPSMEQEPLPGVSAAPECATVPVETPPVAAPLSVQQELFGNLAVEQEPAPDAGEYAASFDLALDHAYERLHQRRPRNKTVVAEWERTCKAYETAGVQMAEVEKVFAIYIQKIGDRLAKGESPYRFTPQALRNNLVGWLLPAVRRPVAPTPSGTATASTTPVKETAYGPARLVCYLSPTGNGRRVWTNYTSVSKERLKLLPVDFDGHLSEDEKAAAAFCLSKMEEGAFRPDDWDPDDPRTWTCNRYDAFGNRYVDEYVPSV